MTVQRETKSALCVEMTQRLCLYGWVIQLQGVSPSTGAPSWQVPGIASAQAVMSLIGVSVVEHF